MIAMRAARSPNHGRGSKKPNMASEGMVCSTLATPITGFAHRGERVSHTPAGIASVAAKSIAAPVSQRCSIVSVPISFPYCDRNGQLMIEQPHFCCEPARDEMREHKRLLQDVPS